VTNTYITNLQDRLIKKYELMTADNGLWITHKIRRW